MADNDYKILITPVLNTSEINDGLNKAGKTGGKEYSKTFLEETQKILANRLKYALADTVISGFARAIKGVISNVTKLDSAMTELRKVTNYTANEYSQFIDEAYKAGSKVARTGTEIVQASTEFAKMGYTDKSEILNLAEMATRFQNIADAEVSAADAASLINSQLKAFGKDLSAEDVIDKINEVSNNFGVSSTDISTALTKTAGAMATYGNDMDRTIALITAGTELMPKQASKVARGWRTIGANIVKLSNETDTWVEANGKVKVALKDEQGELRSTYDIMNDLFNGTEEGSVAWNKLSDAERSNIALNIAGKSQMEVFAASMNNFVHAQEAYITSSTKYFGSSSKENAKYLDSIEGRLQAFRSAWEKLSKDLISTDLIKDVISLGTNLLEVLDKLINTFGALPTSTALVWGLVRAFKGLEGLSIASILDKLNKLFIDGGSSKTFHIRDLAEEAKKAEEDFASYHENVTDAVFETIVDKNSKYHDNIKKSIDSTDDLGDAVSDVIDEMDDAGSNKSIFDKLKSFLLSPIGATIALVGFAVALKKLGDYISSDNYLGIYKDINDDIKESEDRISELEAKGKDLTDTEQRELDILKLETEERKKQLEYTMSLAKASWKSEAKASQGQGKAGDSSTDFSKFAAESRAALAATNKAIHEAKSAEVAKLLNIDAKAESEAFAEYINSVNDEYDKLVALGGKDWFAELVKSGDTESQEYFKDVVSGFLSVTTSVERYRQALKLLPENETVTITSVDKDGKIKETEIAIKELLGFDDKQIQLIIDAQESQDWSEAWEYIEKHGLTEGNSFYDLVFTFKAEGKEEVEEDKKDVEKDSTSTVTIVADPEPFNNTWKTIDGKEGSATVEMDGKPTKNLVTWYRRMKELIAASKTEQSATGKRKGEHGGLSWLGDEGSASNPKPELVVGTDGAYLAGTKGWELYNLKSSDTVYTASQTKKLLGGKQTFSSNGEIPRYYQGKDAVSLKSAKKVKNAGKKTVQKWFDDGLDLLDYYKDLYDWTDKDYIAEYKRLYNAYASKLSTEQKRKYNLALHEYETDYVAGGTAQDKAKEALDKQIGAISYGGKKSGALSALDKAKEAGYITVEDYNKYRSEIYDNNYAYIKKEYEAGRQSWTNLLKSAEEYWDVVGKDSEEYYKNLEDLRDVAQEREESKLSLAQKYLNLQKEQLENQKEANDKLKEEQELQDELAKSKKDMIKVYREGVGWVYEADAEALKDIQDQYAEENDELQKQIDYLEDILDLFNEINSQNELNTLAQQLGVSSLLGLTGLTSGSGLDAWRSWIENIYKEIFGLETASDDALYNILTSNINGYATGTLSAHGGLSLVGEHGAELAWLGKGDSVFTNRISSNLMQWGAYSPAQIIEGIRGAGNNVFNFDQIVLPNVKNANDFMKELALLPNKAIQNSARR